MKNIVLIMLVAFSLNAKAQQMIKAEIVATGLTCSMCSNAINKQLKSIAEVDSVAIDLNKNLFIVYLKNDNKLSPNDLKNKVEKAGFFVGSFVAYLNINNVAIADNTQLDNFVFIDSKAQTVNGIVKVKLLNKGFVTAKDFKKLQKAYEKYSSFNTNNNKAYFIKLV
jgi:copper chaperone CopZ